MTHSLPTPLPVRELVDLTTNVVTGSATFQTASAGLTDDDLEWLLDAVTASDDVALLKRVFPHLETAPRYQRHVCGRKLLQAGHPDIVFAADWAQDALVMMGPDTDSLPDVSRAAVVSRGESWCRQRMATTPSDGDSELGLLSPYDFKHYSSSTQEALVAWLLPRVTQASAAGDYDELDYPYGAVWPLMELATCLAHVGRHDEALAMISAQPNTPPSFINAEGMQCATQLYGALPPALKEHWWSEFRAWAQQSDIFGVAVEGALEVEWLLTTTAPPSQQDAARQALESAVAAEDADPMTLTSLMALGPEPVKVAAVERAIVGLETPEDMAHRPYDRITLLHLLALRAPRLSNADTERVAAVGTRWQKWALDNAGSEALETTLGFLSVAPGSVQQMASAQRRVLDDKRPRWPEPYQSLQLLYKS